MRIHMVQDGWIHNSHSHTCDKSPFIDRPHRRLAMTPTYETSSSRNYVKMIKFVSSYMKI